MDFVNNKEKDEDNKIQKVMDKLYKISQLKKKTTSTKMKNYLITEEDKKIENYVKNLISEYNLQINAIINAPLNLNKFDGYLFAYAIQKVFRNDHDTLYLIHSLKFYDIFNNLLIKINDDEEKIFLFSQIISKIKIEQKKEKDMLFKLGENSEKFYFLLSGSATRLITYQFDVMMDKYEYYIYMKYLYKINELELFNLTLVENGQIFDKYELLHFILEDKNLKFHRNVIIQLKKMEASYVSQRINKNKLNAYNFYNQKSIIISGKKHKIEDIMKGDYIISCLDEHIKRINVPIEEYINNLKPIVFQESEDDDLDKRTVTLHIYKIDEVINVGMHLEELEDHKLSKRNSTIICNNNCIFGCLYKKEYFNCKKITQTKFHVNDILFLLENEIFLNLCFSDFDRNYYHLFELTKVPQNQILYCQKEKNDYIYFLKKGEASVSMEGNINDLYRIIGLKGGPKNRKVLDTNYIKRFYSININNNFFEKNSNFALLKINENFPIGLEDFIDEENENRQLFNVICNMNSEVLIIKNEDLNDIAYREKDVYKSKEKYIIKRKNLLIKKLNSLKNGLLEKYIYEKYKIKVTLPEIFEETALISTKKINKQFEYLYETSPKRKNELTHMDTKFNGKSFIEITTALKTKENNEFISGYNEKNECKKNKKTENDISRNKDTILKENLNLKSLDTINSTENDKTSLNSSNSTKRINRSRRLGTSLKMATIREAKTTKVNQEILELIRSQNYNKIIRLNKSKKDVFDPLDRLYKNLKYPSISNSNSIKLFPKKNIGYEIKSLNVLTPVKPHKFIPNNRKVILPQKSPKHGFFSKLMKEIKMFKTKTQDKPSVILKTETAPHIKYFDRNNNLLATINFQKNSRNNTKEKTKLIFNSMRINNPIRNKISQSMDKYNKGINTDDFICKTGKTIFFPKIINSINKT